jgi:serine/threonine protein kinase
MSANDNNASIRDVILLLSAQVSSLQDQVCILSDSFKAAVLNSDARIIRLEAAVLAMSASMTRASSIASRTEKNVDSTQISKVSSDLQSSLVLSDDIKSLQFKMSEIVKLRQICFVSHDTLFEAKLRGAIVAASISDFHDLSDEDIETLHSEVSILCSLRHRNVFEMIGFAAVRTEICTIHEYLPCTSLDDIIYKPQQQLSFQQKLQICSDVARGMEYLHSQNPPVVHGNLQCSSLLVSSDGEIKIAGYGFLKFRMPTSWLAPETISSEEYSTQSDVYSFGITMFEIVTREEPYHDVEAMQIVLDTVNKGLRPKIPQKFSACPLVPLMVECWSAVLKLILINSS